MKTPRIELDLAKISDNAKILNERLLARGIGVMGVTKVMLGSPHVARALLSSNIRIIGDSRIENIDRMRNAGIEACFVLIRSPSAVSQKRNHKIILMIEMGDIREGVPENQLADLIGRVMPLEGIELLGLGTNLACFGGVIPNIEKMQGLSLLTQAMESRFNIRLLMTTGGNSANFEWLAKTDDVGRINNLRLGESIYLGLETTHRLPIEGLHLNAIVLVGEVIESKIKPSRPSGELSETAFGQREAFKDKGNIRRSLVGMGRQDVDVGGLTPMGDFDILGASSDHIILDSTRAPLGVGDQVRFKPNYASLLAAMTSPFVKKVFLNLSA